jgi:1-acyl-sn-glycerol-3-phosphate acyltransferase
LLIRLLLRPYLHHFYGLERFECIDGEKLRQSLDDGCGVLVISNHIRPCDPMACGYLTRVVRQPMYCMASRHIFENAWIDRVLSRRCGAFSVYREGTDHASLQFAVQSLVEPDRPVIIFAEGSAGRMNDRVQPMLDGSALIARTAARRRAKQQPPGKVVIHPLAFKYFFRGDLIAAVEPVLSSIERRLNWPVQNGGELLPRIRRIGRELLAQQEIKYLGKAQPEQSNPHCLHDRLEGLIEAMLAPLEKRYKTTGGRSIYIRVQQVRTKLLPDLIAGRLTAEKEAERQEQLKILYDAQELGSFPRDYLGQHPSAERILETVEKLEENLTDRVTVHSPFDCVMQVGDAIDVSPHRERKSAAERSVQPTRDGPHGSLDPLTGQAQRAIQSMVDGLSERGAKP